MRHVLYLLLLPFASFATNMVYAAVFTLSTEIYLCDETCRAREKYIKWILCFTDLNNIQLFVLILFMTVHFIVKKE
jgi:hypothetical protein